VLVRKIGWEMGYFGEMPCNKRLTDHDSGSGGGSLGSIRQRPRDGEVPVEGDN